MTLSALTKPNSIWYSMRKAPHDMAAGSTRTPARFGMRVVMDVRSEIVTNPAAVVKPVFDGVIASFHRHDETALNEIAERLAEESGASREEVISLFTSPPAPLGTRRLLWLQGGGV